MERKLLLHQCCAICTAAIYRFLSTSYTIEGFWYNPNIHPLQERQKRFSALKDFNDTNGVETINYRDCDAVDWLKGTDKSSDRCEYCYLVRLKCVANFCLQKGYKYFSTTLLSSPYQKHELIKKIAESIALKNDLRFVYLDARKNYHLAKSEIKKMGLYCQRYCGCVFSIKE